MSATTTSTEKKSKKSKSKKDRTASSSGSSGSGSGSGSVSNNEGKESKHEVTGMNGSAPTTAAASSTSSSASSMAIEDNTNKSKTKAATTAAGGGKKGKNENSNADKEKKPKVPKKPLTPQQQYATQYFKFNSRCLVKLGAGAGNPTVMKKDKKGVMRAVSQAPRKEALCVNHARAFYFGQAQRLVFAAAMHAVQYPKSTTISYMDVAESGRILAPGCETLKAYCTEIQPLPRNPQHQQYCEELIRTIPCTKKLVAV